MHVNLPKYFSMRIFSFFQWFKIEFKIIIRVICEYAYNTKKNSIIQGIITEKITINFFFEKKQNIIFI